MKPQTTTNPNYNENTSTSDCTPAPNETSATKETSEQQGVAHDCPETDWAAVLTPISERGVLPDKTTGALLDESGIEPIEEPGTSIAPPFAIVRDARPKFMSTYAIADKITPAMRDLAKAIFYPPWLGLEIHEAYPATEEDLIANSPVAIPKEPELQKAAILNLFHEDDLVFASDKLNAQKAECSTRLKSSIQGDSFAAIQHISPWVVSTRDVVPGAPIAETRRLLVLTSDPLEETPSAAAIFRWLSIHVGMKLLAATSDASGVHGIFAPLAPDTEETVAAYLTFHGLVEGGSFDKNELLRLPGTFPRARLVYLAEGCSEISSVPGFAI